MIPRKRSLILFSCLLAASAAAAAKGGASEFQTRHLGWLTLASLYWSSLMLDWPAVRALLQRSWLITLPAAAIMELLLPALLFGLPFLGWLVGTDMGQRPGFGSDGITLHLTRHLTLFSPLFFLFCGTIGFCLGLMKVLFLKAFASDRPRVAGVLAIFIMGFLSTMTFLGGVVFDQQRAIASVQGFVMGQMGGGKGGATSLAPHGGKSGNPVENLAAPLKNYYENLNQQIPKR